MTKLSTAIPLKYIKQCPKLQEIECDKFYTIEDEVEKTYSKRKETMWKEDGDVSAPTIADIIDNAEELFNSTYVAGADILKLCQQNKSINEISEYIVKNIKGG